MRRSSSFSPLAVKGLCGRGDLRKRPERATYSAGLLRTAMLCWMMAGGIPCDAFGAFILAPGVAESISRIASALGYSAYMNSCGQSVLPGIDLLRLEIERMPPAWLQEALESAVSEALDKGILEGLGIGGRLLLAIDGTDGFSTHMDVRGLLCRRSGGRKTRFAKMLVASAVGPGLGGGLPVGAQFIRNSDGYEDAGGDAGLKQACEQGTLPLLLERMSGYLPLADCILLLDGLYMNGVVIRRIHEYGCGCFITLKDDALDRFHESLEQQFQASGEECVCEDADASGGKTVTLKYEMAWMNGVRYKFGGEDTPDMNYLSVIVTKYAGGIKEGTMKFAWMTNIRLDGDALPVLQMIARRRWGVETQNNGQKHQGMALTHKYDSRGNAPANFMYLAQLADLMRKVLLYSDIYDREAESAAAYPVPDTKHKVLQKRKLKPQEEKPQEEKPQEGKPQEGKPQEEKPQEEKPQEGGRKEGEETAARMGDALKRIRIWRKEALKACSLKYWGSVKEWCAAVMAAMSRNIKRKVADKTDCLKMKWRKLGSQWQCRLRWGTEP